MNNERLNRHTTQENLALRSEVSQLKTQVGAWKDMYNNSQDEVLRLLNQIASDMVKRSDVDEIVKNAVSEEHDRMVTFYEEKMKAMAAEYEAKIAALEKTNGKGGNKGRRQGYGYSLRRLRQNRKAYSAVTRNDYRAGVGGL